MTHHMRFYPALIATALAGAITGCSTGMVIGSSPSDPPPQIAFLGARDGQGNDYLTWENVSSFGPVPSELKAAGDASCMSVGPGLRAIGYHPRARDRKGNQLPGGGFFCQPSVLSSDK
jgi:hypothetical protein